MPTMLTPTAKDLRREGQADQGRVSAIRCAHDRDLAATRDTLAHRPFHRIDQIVVHFAGVFLRPGVDEILSKAGRGAIVHGQHRITAVCQPLVIRAIAVDVATPGSAVHNQHHGQRLGRPRSLRLGWQRQIRHEIEPIAGFDHMTLHRRQPISRKLRARAEQ